MLRATWLGVALTAVFFSTAIPLSATRGQVRIPAAAFEKTGGFQQVLDHGQELERARRWGEALTHYEGALRTYPEKHEIQQRLTLARIHFDLARRYADSSFGQALRAMSQRQALDLYGEVLLKVYTHYVSPPDWQRLVRHGTDSLDVALTDPIFVQRHLPTATVEQLTGFRRELHQHLDWRQVPSRQEANQIVALAGRLAWQHVRLSPAAAILEYACGAAGALDDYSTYLTPAQLDDVFSQIEGNFVGLGIELNAAGDSLLIVKVLPGSPAERGGLGSGDRIVEVDGQSTREVSTDKAADMLKGEQGSTVDVTVVTPQDTERRIQLRRERVEVPSVEDVKILDREAGVGYMRLTTFQKTTSRDVDAAMWKLHREGMTSLIVDVRGNPGGLLTASVDVADKFVTDGTIVSTRGRSPREDFDYRAHRVGTWRVPLVVLVDCDSASASEIFAAAIRDHRRGTVVGQRSYGKGSVQGIFPMNLAKAGLRLTTAKFYGPSGRPIGNYGVSPDIAVRVAAKPTEQPVRRPQNDLDDPVIAAGVQAARRQLAQR